jgi:hypothetical protein|tara:strand:- start:461 stop:643 length:183 start_codon:yes stop_codon:yes gene_type:complete
MAINPFSRVSSDARSMRFIRDRYKPITATPTTKSRYSAAQIYQEEIRKILQGQQKIGMDK